MFSSHPQKDSKSRAKCCCSIKSCLFLLAFPFISVLRYCFQKNWIQQDHTSNNACQHAHVLTRDHSVVITTLLHETTAMFKLRHHVLFNYTMFHDGISCDAVMLTKSAHEDRHSVQTPGKVLKMTDTEGLYRNTFCHNDFNLNEQRFTSSILPAPRGRRLFMLRPSRFYCQECLSAMIEWTTVTFHHQPRKRSQNRERGSSWNSN